MLSYSPEFSDGAVTVLRAQHAGSYLFIAIVRGDAAVDFDVSHYQEKAGCHPAGYGPAYRLRFRAGTDVPGSVVYEWECAASCD